MGLPSVEELSNVLIKAGAKRIVKDLVRNLYLEIDRNGNRSMEMIVGLNFQKSRQPSYYFMNKSDIERLREEEESFVK